MRCDVCGFTLLKVSYVEVSNYNIMNELSEIRALISAMEKLVDRHPDLDTELQELFEMELASEHHD